MPTTAHPPAPGELIFAPVGIAHLTRDNTDLLRAAARGKQRLRVTTAAQLNGTPHIGTVVTVLSVFAITAHAANGVSKPSSRPIPPAVSAAVTMNAANLGSRQPPASMEAAAVLKSKAFSNPA